MLLLFVNAVGNLYNFSKYYAALDCLKIKSLLMLYQ